MGKNIFKGRNKSKIKKFIIFVVINFFKNEFALWEAHF